MQTSDSRKRKKRTGSVITRHPLAVSLLCGGLAVVFVLAYVGQVNVRAEETRAEMLARYGGEQVEVCVATRDIAPGDVVDAAAVQVRVWVADLLPARAIVQPGDVVGRPVTSAVFAGEVFTEGRFAVSAAHLQVPDGMTAVSVPAKDVQAVGGAIEPGMRIDIYATGSSMTRLIGGDVLVLATNRQPGGATDVAGGQAVQWLTLALEPESVEETVAAAQSLALYFTLPGEGASAGSLVREDVWFEDEDAGAEAPVADGAGLEAGEEGGEVQ